MSKYEKIDNYNLSYDLLLEAIKEFNGFILGLGNNKLETFNKEFDINLLQPDADENNLKLFLDFIYEFTDRTTGNYFLSSLIDNNSNTGIKQFILPSKIEEYLGVISNDKYKRYTQVAPLIAAMPRYADKGADTKFISDDCLKKVIRTEENNTNNTNTVEIINPEVNKNVSPAKEDSPHVNAVVIKHPKASSVRKNANHLPVFFNAITPIEMSKCAAYINLIVMSRKFSNTSSNLSLIKNFKFNYDKNSSTYNLDPSFEGLKPVELNNIQKKDLYNFGFMDIFTSPQTLSNANINKSDSGIIRPNENNEYPILEPIMPLLSLSNVKVSISGKGYGIMSSKTADLSLVLHDRTRMSEISALISSNQIAGTKIIIEYGWNHPEGGVNSDNTIGKYLNALKDMGVFQVTSSNYSFNKNGSVNINLKLASAGFRHIERVHAGAGHIVPSNFLTDILDEIYSEYTYDDGAPKEKVAEVRQKLRLNINNAKDIYSNFTWKEYRELIKSINSNNNDKETVKNDLKQFITKMLDEQSSNEKYDNKLNDKNKNKKSTMNDDLLNKLGYFDHANFKDPFLNQYSYLKDNKFVTEGDYNTQYTSYVNNININEDAKKSGDKFITLGSILMSFVAHPLASTGNFDEVQMIFNPLNHQSAGARKYTTANFPISLKKLKEVIKMALEDKRDLNVLSFVNLLENKILKDVNSLSYGLTEEYKLFSELEKKTDAEKNIIISNAIKNKNIDSLGFDPQNNLLDTHIQNIVESIGDNTYETSFANYEIPQKSDGTESEIKKEQIDSRMKELFNNHLNRAKKDTKEKVKGKLASIYNEDGYSQEYITTDKFVLPNLTLDYEVVPVIDSNSDKERKNFFNRMFQSDSDKSNQNYSGILYDKSILKIFVYDQESVLSPNEYALLNILTGESEGIIEDQKSKSEMIKKLKYLDVKNLIKRSYPTIIYGASTSTIDSISLSANTSGKLANILMVESYNNLETGNTNTRSVVNDLEEITLFPGQVSIECTGNPMISRGNNIFIDFQTNTTLDNIYSVVTVDHTIAKGKFTTSLKLVPSQMGTIKTFRSNLEKLTK